MFAKASLWLAADKGIDALARAMGAIAEDTAQTKLEVDFNSCAQLSDIGSIGGGLEKLVSLQQLTMDFGECAQISDISSIGGGLEKLVNLQQLTMYFERCDQLTGQEVLNATLEGMFGEGHSTSSGRWCCSR